MLPCRLNTTGPCWLQMINLSRRWWMSWSRSPKSCSIARPMMKLLPNGLMASCRCRDLLLVVALATDSTGDMAEDLLLLDLPRAGLQSRCPLDAVGLKAACVSHTKIDQKLLETGNSELPFLAGNKHDFLQSAVTFLLKPPQFSAYIETSRKNLTGSATYSQRLQRDQQQAISDNPMFWALLSGEGI